MHLKRFHFTRHLLLLAALACAGCAKEAPRDGAPPDATAPVEGAARSDDGTRIAYVTAGTDAPALVFVHGWSCDKSYWDPQFRFFAATHRVVAIDLAGHGASDTTRREWTVESYADDVAAVVMQLGLTDVVLIGHSMGGPIAVEAARRLPGRVRGIVGADTFQDVTETFPESERVAFVGGFHRNFVEMTRAFVLGMFPETADSALVARVVDDMSAGDARVGAGSMDHMFLHDMPAALREVRVPVHAINCDRWPTNTEANRRHFAAFTLDLMPGRGHFVMLEDSTTFNRLLAQAVARFEAP